MKKSKGDWARELMVPLYLEKYIQTLWNAEKKENQKEGWSLRNTSWALWFFNMRPVGGSVDLFYQSCAAMADLISGHKVDRLIAVDMAGINLSGGMAVVSMLEHGIGRPIGYTRPLPWKARTPFDALEIIRKIETDPMSDAKKLKTALETLEVLETRESNQTEIASVLSLLRGIKISSEDYGQKEYVEGRMYDGDILGIYDDMANDVGSKVIARLIVLWEAKRRGISVTCDKVFYLLNRTATNKQRGLDFAKESEQGLYPAALEIDYIIEFDEHFPILKKVMKPEEFDTIQQFQKNPKHFQDKDVQKEVLALAARTM